MRGEEDVRIGRARAAYEAFSAGRFEEAGAYFHPEAIVRRADIGPDGGEVVRGREAIVALMRPDTFTDQRIDPVEFVEVSDGVVARLSISVRGTGSGMEIVDDVYHRIRFDSDCRVIELAVYLDRERALAGGGG